MNFVKICPACGFQTYSDKYGCANDDCRYEYEDKKQMKSCSCCDIIIREDNRTETDLCLYCFEHDEG